MCEALDKVEVRGKKIGMLIGREEGRVLAYADVGLTVEQIVQKVGITEEEVINILKGQESK